MINFIKKIKRSLDLSLSSYNQPFINLEYSHQLMEKIPFILHKKPIFSILHYHFCKTLTSVYLFYKTFQ